MKLSEAILVGRHILAPKAGTLHASTPEGQAGCALGMAAVAKGCTFRRYKGPISPGDSMRALGTAAVWGDWVRDKVRRPCGCWLVPKRMQVQHIIPHLFDKHVMGKKADWTLYQLVEWVKTVEPMERKVFFQRPPMRLHRNAKEPATTAAQPRFRCPRFSGY